MSFFDLSANSLPLLMLLENCNFKLLLISLVYFLIVLFTWVVTGAWFPYVNFCFPHFYLCAGVSTISARHVSWNTTGRPAAVQYARVLHRECSNLLKVRRCAAHCLGLGTCSEAVAYNHTSNVLNEGSRLRKQQMDVKMLTPRPQSFIRTEQYSNSREVLENQNVRTRQQKDKSINFVVVTIDCKHFFYFTSLNDVSSVLLSADIDKK